MFHWFYKIENEEYVRYLLEGKQIKGLPVRGPEEFPRVEVWRFCERLIDTALRCGLEVNANKM